MNIPDFDDEHLIFGLLFMLGNRLQVVGDKFYDEISSKQWFVLLMLNLFGEIHPTMNELSEAVGSSHQNVKQLVLKLEQKGYVELYSDDADKRKCRVKMTDRCDEINQKYRNKQNEFMKTLFSGIDRETLKATSKALVKLEENMEMMK
jgi:DNA-binding MarR family transcriptional regulator